MAQFCPQRKDPGGELVLLGAVTVGSCLIDLAGPLEPHGLNRLDEL